MHENSFEKRVKEKMEELRIPPPERIWENIAKDLSASGRRRTPLWWLFLFAGLVLLGGGYYLKNRAAKKPMEMPVDHQVELIQQSGKSSSSKTPFKTIVRPGSEKDSSNQQSLITATGDQIGPLQSSRETHRTANHRTGLKMKTSLVSFLSGPQLMINKSDADEPIFAATRMSGKRITKDGQTKAAIDRTDQDWLLNRRASRLPVDGADLSQSLLFFSLSNITPGQHPGVFWQQSGLHQHQKIAPQKSPGQWHSGFTFTVGTSAVNRSLFASINRANNPASSVLGPGSSPGNSSASPLSPDFSFGVGDFLYKELSSTVILSAGINYRYYSTAILTGRIVDSALNYSGSNRSALPTSVSSYFRLGISNRFINQYHFIELPVAADFGLNPNSKIQVVWEMGVSFCVFLTSNALHFDPAANVYYKDNKQFNEMQVNATTSLMIKGKIGKTYVQIGPQVQYGLTGLLHNDTHNSGHLLYGGIKFSLLPKKD